MRRHDAAEAEYSAYLALLGVKGEQAGDVSALVSYLRLCAKTDQRPSPMLLSALADALENETTNGTRLRLAGSKVVRERVRGVKARIRWMEIGRWVEGMGNTRQDALEAAAVEFAVSYKAADKALDYYRRAMRWMVKSRETAIGRDFAQRFGVNERDAALILHFHQLDGQGAPPD